MTKDKLTKMSKSPIDKRLTRIKYQFEGRHVEIEKTLPVVTSCWPYRRHWIKSPLRKYNQIIRTSRESELIDDTFLRPTNHEM